MTALAIVVEEGQALIRDVELGERLGFARPRKMRELIERHQASLERFGALRWGVNLVRSGKGRETEVKEYLLNKHQALFITSKSDTFAATAVLEVIINTFVAWTEGSLQRLPQVHGSEGASLTTRDREVVGGVVKKVVRLALRDHDEALLNELAALLDLPDHMSAREVLDEARVPSKGRRGLVGRTTNDLNRWCHQRAVHVPRRPHTRTRVFPRSEISAWRRDHGDALISAHLRSLSHQGQLALPSPRSSREKRS